jgi:transketolase
MRRNFARQLDELMGEDDNIILITGDLGYVMFDDIKEKYSNQFYNIGAAEHTMMAMAVGMELKGKIPVVYSITPFLLFRPFEVIRNYINHENIPVIMVGSGRGEDYEDGGFSHDASDHGIISQFKNIRFLAPEKDFNLAEIIYSKKPTYLNLKR